MAKKILSIVLALTLALSVFTVAASAAEINATAESFENDFKTAVNGDVIVLTEDVEIYGNKQTSKDITVDLAGHTITCTATGVAGLIATSKTGNLTITDSVGGGKIDSAYAALQAQVGATVVVEGGTIAGIKAAANFSGAGNIIVNDGVVNAGSLGAIYLDSSYSAKKVTCTVNDGEINGDVFTVANCVLTVNGGEFTSSAYCIVGNGTKKNTAITINGGTFTATSETGAAIYHPQGGTLTINGGTFEGADALYIKSGVTTINGGTFIGNGEAKEYSYYGNGFNSTGDAIVIDSCGYPNGQPPMVKIYDGEFDSIEGKAIGVYTYGESEPATVFVYGGTFSDDSAEGFDAPAVANTTTGTYYETFEAAAQAAAAGDTLVLYKDVAVGAYTAVTDVTIDLSGCDLTSAGNAPLDAFGTITVKDSIGGGKIAGAQRGIWVNTGANVTINNAEVDGVVVEGALTLTDAYIDGYVAGQANSSVTVTGTTTVTDQLSVNGGTLSINNGTFANVYAYNGTTATVNNGTYAYAYFRSGAEATIKNGTFGYFNVQTEADVTIENGTFNGQVDICDNGTLTIQNGTFNNQVVPVGGWPVKGDADATAAKADYVTTLTINGGTFTDDAYNVAGNGTDVATSIVTINGGDFTVAKSGTNIFHPQRGTLTINGGKFLGGDCIYQKSGNVIVNDGEFRAVGVYADFEHTGNGFNQTGETVVVESCGYPGGEPSLRINGGLFYARNNEIISYYYTEGNELDSTAFVYGGQFEKRVAPEYWANANNFGLLNINGGTASLVEGETNKVIITADEGSPKIEVYSNAAEVGTKVTFSDLMGGAKLSAGNQVYAKTSGSFKATIGEDVYDVTIVFQHFDVEDILVVDNATIEVDQNYTVILHAIDSTKMVQVSHGTVNGTEVTFSDLTGNAKVSKGKTLYSVGDGTAVIDVPNSGVYNLVFDFVEPEAPEVSFADTLRTTNATAEVDNGVITLTPVDDSAKAVLINKTTDGKVITFSNIVDAKTSKNGSLYSDVYATATATIEGVAYTVIFDYEVEEVPFAEMLRTTNATVEVAGTTITLTPVDDSANVALINKLTDGTAITFTGLAGAAKTSKNGSLYAKNYATAIATIGGIDYDVVFDCPAEEGPSVAEIIKVTGANVSVSGTTITLTATGTQINVYPKCQDGSTATFSNLDGAKVSKAGTLYAKGDAQATVTIGGTDYSVIFVF